jgi:hypothetical protein
MDVIRDAAASVLVGEDEQRVELVVRPGLPAERIDELSSKFGVRLPGELQDLLPECSGLDGLLADIDFSGQRGDLQGLETLFPRGIPVAQDGFGNSWLLDASAERAEAIHVFFACHDPPVILYQAPSLAAFLAEVVKMYRPPHKSLVDDVHEDRVFEVWRTNPGTLTVAQAATGDQVLRDFAARLDEAFTVVDLRAAEVGMGFSWGRHGPRTRLRRHAEARVFAYGPP